MPAGCQGLLDGGVRCGYSSPGPRVFRERAKRGLHVFEGLGDRIQGVFKELRGEGHLTDFHIETALREIRLSLLEADVALPVVRQFTARVRERAVGAKVAQQLSPAQEVTRIVRDELKALLGGENAELALQGKPAVIALVGLQGSGKTTSAAKLARLLKARGRYPLIVAADLARPAAVQQLVTLGKQIGVPVFEPGGRTDPVEVAREGLREARQTGRDTLIVDTAGRLHLDEALMAEIRAIAAAVEPQEILFVADAMTGQDAVKSAAGFAESLPLTGIVLTKTDGDARGGAALSVVTTTGKPIKFVGVGEKPEDFEAFHPDRMASRILGLGDVLTLIERVEATVDAESARKMAEKTISGDFTLEDLREQLASMKKMGPLEGLLDLLPKGGALKALKGPESVDEKALTRTTAMIDSMTVEERQYPQILNGSRKKRVAAGSGTSVAELNRLLKQYQQMRRLMRTAKKGARGLDLSKMAFPAPRNQ
jgi:signal recognition particle subunit SRP54